MPPKSDIFSSLRQVMPAVCIGLLLGGCSPPKAHPIYAQIAKEKAGLPAKVSAESLALSGGFLSTSLLVELLSDRNVKMVEVMPVRARFDPQLAILAWDERAWTMPVALFKFVQFRLAVNGDGTCIPSDKLPSRLRTALERPPIVPGTCLSMTISPASAARHVIRLRKREGAMAYDQWELVDTASNKTKAIMSTSEPPLTQGPNRDLRDFDDRYPHTNLLRLVDRSDAVQAPSDRFFMRRVVVASGHPNPKISGKEGAEVAVFMRRVQYPKPKTGFLDSDDWPKAVAKAQTTGWGSYLRDLLEQASGVRWNLDLNLPPSDVRVSSIDTPRFNVEAGDRGFYVSPDSYDPEKRDWLSYYDVKGQLLWQVFLPPRLYRSENPSCFGYFHLARTTPDEIVFQRNCYGPDDVEGFQQVEERFIRKKDIAAQLGRAKMD